MDRLNERWSMLKSDTSDRIEDLIHRLKLSEIYAEKEEEARMKRIILTVLAVIGAIAAVAGIAFAVYKFMSKDYLEDYEDDFDDDFLIEEGPEEPFQEQVAEEILADHLSVRETEKLVKELQEGRKKTRSVKKERTEDIYLAELARLLESSLHTKVQIRQGSKGRGRIEIEYYSNEDLEKLMDRLRQ